MHQIDIAAIIAIAKEAGEAIMAIYEDDQLKGQVAWKADHSPLTLADQAAHGVIQRALLAQYPAIPLLSEEGNLAPYSQRKTWQRYWCVDPLDGTREFINRNGEFTVNIALIEENKPVLGVIYVPVTGVVYAGSARDGAFKVDPQGLQNSLKVRPKADSWVSVGSRSHASEYELKKLSKFPIAKSIAIGSSLKFGLLAEGLAQVYYRHGPTMEWDTAAGHAILKYSGGTLTGPQGEDFLYNKEDLHNGSFLCLVGE
ncbi:3'(2'), 5'-bisphosphate nucleotidase [Dyadobacter jejuensis]|uniref:3'(2'),5'-bisphosphate nucleotidase CysQ n=1 Tax=Dyadobacter jejuensis TaxID=1082580 RepID=A0A316API9_9BACT|nr:3'(2'),5'-bisphosphate nucleotidase CysQ [Dyadobacter jejuensis]PWJ59199.1 3'(2'), 5'-bisphosphate nucleotidase [Dyadobacter jejuensis]